MTPVQLPEVPAPHAFLHNMAHNPLYTAAQLREYATAAVLADRELAWANAKWIDQSETNSER